MKRILFLVEDDELKISSSMFYVLDRDRDLKKLKEIEKDLWRLSKLSWHNFHYRFFNSIAIKQLFGERER